MTGIRRTIQNWKKDRETKKVWRKYHPRPPINWWAFWPVFAFFGFQAVWAFWMLIYLIYLKG